MGIHRGRAGKVQLWGHWVAVSLMAVTGCGGGGGTPSDGGSGGSATGGTGSGGDVGTGTGGRTAGSGGAGSGSGGAAGGTQATVLVQGEDEPWSLVVDDTSIYWTTVSSLRKAPKAGGAATTLLTALDSPKSLVTDGTSLFFLLRTSMSDIVTTSKAGGQMSTVATIVGGSLMVDAGFLYWFGDGTEGHGIFRLPKAGGNSTAIAIESSIANYAADDQFVYLTEGYMGRIQRAAKAGATIMDIRPKDSGYMVLARPDATDLYFVTRGDTGLTSTLNRMPKAGGTTTTLASGLDRPLDVAITSDAIYWMAAGDLSSTAGSLLKMSKTDGSVITKVPTRIPYAMTLDDQFVYWIEHGDAGAGNGRILRMAR